MTVHLFVPCFVDMCFPQVAVSMVKVLEKLGHQVRFDDTLTCCGQPAFNSGFWDEARDVAAKVVQRFRAAEAEAVVVASGSCGAMLKVFYPELFAGTAWASAAKELSEKSFEFSDFLVRKLGVTNVGARFPATVTFHDGCHGLRELKSKAPARALLSQVQELKLVEMKEAETCCGFGGTFAAKFPMISTAMGEVKCSSVEATGAEYVVSNDSSCLMHIQGLASREHRKLKTIHLAEILAHS